MENTSHKHWFQWGNGHHTVLKCFHCRPSAAGILHTAAGVYSFFEKEYSCYANLFFTKTRIETGIESKETM